MQVTRSLRTTNVQLRPQSAPPSQIRTNHPRVAPAPPGDDNEVAYDTISGSDAFSPNHGRSGSAVEAHDAIGNTVHRNTAVDNDGFTEFGGARSADGDHEAPRLPTLATWNCLGDAYRQTTPANRPRHPRP